MRSRLTIFCVTCDQDLKNMTKKMLFYHNKYHTQDGFTCDYCKLSFYSEALQNFHIIKDHEKIIQQKQKGKDQKV